MTATNAQTLLNVATFACTHALTYASDQPIQQALAELDTAPGLENLSRNATHATIEALQMLFADLPKNPVPGILPTDVALAHITLSVHLIEQAATRLQIILTLRAAITLTRIHLHTLQEPRLRNQFHQLRDRLERLEDSDPDEPLTFNADERAHLLFALQKQLRIPYDTSMLAPELQTAARPDHFQTARRYVEQLAGTN